MAYIATVRLLIDEPTEAGVCDGINEILREHQRRFVDGGQSCLIDYAIDSKMERIPVELEDAIANDAYEEGEAFRS